MPEKAVLDNAAKLVLHLSKSHPNVAALVRWLDENRQPHEQIDVHPWVGDFWYVVVEDTRNEAYPENMLIGFTVEMVGDRIYWSNDQTYAKDGFKNGGNCFCRSERWWRKLRKQYPEAKSDRRRDGTKDNVGTVHDYRPRRERKVSV